MWKAHFGRSFGPVVRQTITLINYTYITDDFNAVNYRIKSTSQNTVSGTVERESKGKNIVQPIARREI